MQEKMSRFTQWGIDLSILENEFSRLVDEEFVDFENYRNKTFLVTGATGLIGSLLTKFLLYLGKKKGLNITVIAVIRNEEKFLDTFGRLAYSEHLVSLKSDLAKDEINTENHIDFIVHTAAITNSRKMISDPVGTAKVSINGTEKILRLAVKKNVESMVYISSMEIYGQVDGPEMKKEDQLGYVDLSLTRSVYPEGKRMCECLCTAFSSQFNVNVKSARLAQTFGVGISKDENRVFAQFAKSARLGKDIVLHTTGESEGNYVYTMDAIKGILIILNKGNKAEAYNVSNPKNHTSILGMAQLVEKLFDNKKINVVIDIPRNKDLGYAPDTKLYLNSEKLQKLGWIPRVDLKESYMRMFQWMDEQGF